VPDVVSRDAAAARAVLEQAGFVVRVTTRTVAQGVEGTVLAQTPAAGSTRPLGSVVKIVLANVRTPVTRGKPSPTTSPSGTKKASAPK
jgi:beta-lactam-binding protein with PASTA domain